MRTNGTVAAMSLSLGMVIKTSSGERRVTFAARPGPSAPNMLVSLELLDGTYAGRISVPVLKRFRAYSQVYVGGKWVRS